MTFLAESYSGWLQLPDGSGVLIDIVTKATIILTVAGILVAVLRRHAAALRHLILTVAVSSLLVLPVLSLVLPWRIPYPAKPLARYLRPIW